jgi:hypothetical protein
LLATIYAQWLTVPVVDQFGNPLDPMYNGVDVKEDNNIPINQTISNGTYLDPVGPVEPVAQVLAGGNAEAEFFKMNTIFHLHPRNGHAIQGYMVEVGGWTLTGGPDGWSFVRTLDWTTDDDGNVTVQVTWP